MGRWLGAVGLLGLLLSLGTVSGCGNDEGGTFHGPLGIAVDATGKIYVTDYANNRIVRMNDMTGAGWTTFGMFGSGANQFNGPWGIAVDAAGKIYVTDGGNERIVSD
jgi:DNA-binding beta-propeller fold protein YncE